MTYALAGRLDPNAVINLLGRVQVGATLQVNNAGTLVAATAYTDKTKASTAGNPTTTTPQGNYPVLFFAPGDYDVIQTVDGVAQPAISVTVRPDATEPTLANGAVKPAAADGMVFATTSGLSTNDGHSWGSASDSFVNAAALLPGAGGVVNAGAGTFTTSATFAMTSYQNLRGRGQRASQKTFTAASGYAVSAGNATYGSALAYGIGIEGMAFFLTQNGSGGVTLRETGMAGLRRLYIEGQGGTQSNTAVFVDGGDTSNLYTHLEDIIANHVKIGYRFGCGSSSGSGAGPTSANVFNCTAFGDAAAASVGFQFDAATTGQTSGAGSGSNIFGGNAESLGTGVLAASSAISAASGLSGFGVRFESNITDISIGTFSAATAWFGCHGLSAVVDSSGAGYNNQTFLGCNKGDRTPYPNSLWGGLTVNAWNATGSQTALTVVGWSGQSSGTIFLVNDSAGNPLVSVRPYGSGKASLGVGQAAASITSPWNATVQVFDGANCSLSVRTNTRDWHIATEASGGLFFRDNTAGADAARLFAATSSTIADGATALQLARNVGGSVTLQPVTMGAADSGGTGFKLLRVPN